MNTNASHEVGTRVEVALRAALEAGRLIERHARARSYSVDTKGDGSPVTTADREAEECIVGIVRQTFAGDAILGEEFGEQAGNGRFRWTIDPIDGTASFVHGVPLYGTLIGLELNGRCVGGVIHMPGLHETVYGGEGGGAWHLTRDGERHAARVSRVDRAAEAMVCVTSLDYFTKQGRVEEFQRIARACRSMRGWSDCYSHLLVATGRADAVIEPSLHPWDIAASIAIIREAGGRTTSWSGEETAYSGDGVVSNGLVHDELLAVLRGE